MVSIVDIPDFPGQPGQRPTPGAPTSVVPVPVVLVSTRLDRGYMNMALNAASVDAFIAAEIAAGRALVESVERWNPWSDLQLEIPLAQGVNYNYARFTLGGRNWYAFITGSYLNLTDTHFTVEPDAWVTYDASVGYSMVTRGHVAVAASQSDTYGDLFCTAPEPILAEPVRGILSANILGSTSAGWTVLVVSANDLRGGASSPSPFWSQHIRAADIASANNMASAATITHDAIVQFTIPAAIYPWDSNSGLSGGVTDTIFPGHAVTNPGGTIASGWQWHIDNSPGRGGDDFAYNFETFRAPAAGVVDHFDVAGVGMVVRLTLDQPTARTSPQQPQGDAYGPIFSIWFEHCSAAIDGPCVEGAIIGTSGDGYGTYPAHLHVHALTDHSSVAGTANRACMWGFLGAGSAAPAVAVPLVKASPVSTIDGVSAGGGAYLFTPQGFAEYMGIMQGAPWVTSGIIDVRLVPSWSVGGGGDATYTPSIPSLNPADSSWSAAAAIPVFVGNVVSSTTNPTVLAGWRDTVMSALGAGIYRKILTSPFIDLLVGAGDATQTFRPDQWQTSGLTFEAVTGAAHGEASIRLQPLYNLLGNQRGLSVATGGRAGLSHTGYAIAASNTANQDLAPYLNAYSSKQNWFAAQRNRELAVTLGQTNIQLNSGAFGVVTALTGAAGGATGGALGAVTPGHEISGLALGAGAALGSIGAIGQMATAQAQANNTLTMLAIGNDTSFDINAYQLGLSGELAVETFDTWWQSLHSASGSGTPSALSSAWRAIVGQAFQAVVVVPSAERVRALLAEWGRYGYMIGQAFVPPRLDPMTHYSYWQLADPTILGSMPQAARELISSAFERGVTIWSVVSEIGTQPDNQPQGSVTY